MGVRPQYLPLLQCVDDVGELVGAEVPTHAAVHLHLLVPLVQLALDDVAVHSVDQQVLQLTHVLQLQLLQQQRVGQALWGGGTRTHTHGKQVLTDFNATSRANDKGSYGKIAHLTK